MNFELWHMLATAAISLLLGWAANGKLGNRPILTELLTLMKQLLDATGGSAPTLQAPPAQGGSGTSPTPIPANHPLLQAIQEAALKKVLDQLNGPPK